MACTSIVLAALSACVLADVPSSPFQENVDPFFLPKALINAHFNAQVKSNALGPHLTNRARNYANIDCEPRRAQRCQARFADNLRASRNIFRNPDEFRQALTRFYHRFLENGLLRLCSYRAEYFTCLGNLYEPCTDVFQIARQQPNASFGDAFYMAFLYKTVAFDCLGGNVRKFSSSIPDYSRMKVQILRADFELRLRLDTLKNADHQGAEQVCYNNFIDAINSDPQAFCSNAQTLLTCAANLWLNNTCPSTELAWWRCEHSRVGFAMDGFCPNLDCNVVINPPANAPAQVSDTGSDGTSGSAITSFGAHGLNGYGLSPEWERRMIGGGAFVSDARLHLYKELSRHHMKKD
ncbi:hypothetical protein DdX_15122 [Ditylenchus destructor]|uniref:Secreted protein n=1 Tax=Ditylenchus destructor TaxID=166010 RepID=A0AAD4R146_9BILA|nr:hypothetical protein DdX_15122 [Ditylenchus destructor]